MSGNSRPEVRHDLYIEPATRSVSSLPGNVYLTCSDGLLIGYKVARQFESHPLRHTVWHASLHYGEAMKSARGARFTRGRGRGECRRQRLSVKIALNSLFALLACPSANRPTFCGEAFSGRTLPDASNYARVSLSGFQSLLLRTPERGEFDSLGHR